MGFDGVAEAHQLLRDNKHLGKIAASSSEQAEGEGKHAKDRARSAPRWGWQWRVAWRRSTDGRRDLDVNWYATVMRQYTFAEEVVKKVAPLALLRRHPVLGPHLPRRPLPDYPDVLVREQGRLVPLLGEPEMIEFRARFSGPTTS